MSNKYFNRYQYFEQDGGFKIIPGLEISIKATDEYEVYKKGKTRLDKLSEDKYDSPLFGWLILQANPLAGSLEFEIPDNFMLRIPKPLIPTLQDYKRAVELYQLYYGT